MNFSKFQNQFTIEEAIGRMTIAVVAHPFDLTKTLIQLGYEPLPPRPVVTLFRTTKLAYPSVFGYLTYIRQQDGFTGMFRGLRYKMLYTLVNGFVYVNLTEYIKHYETEHGDSAADGELVEGSSSSRSQRRLTIKDLFDQLMRETFTKFITLSISYPIQLLVVRSYAQFVGHEQVYDSLGSAITDVYNQGGLLGFYAGFVPKFCGDVIILWTSHGLIFLVKRFIDGDSGVQGYLAATINFVVASIMYPFSLVSTVMAVNGPEASTLMASTLTPDFNHDWSEAWRHLSGLGQIKRGSSLLWRYHTPNQPSLKFA